MALTLELPPELEKSLRKKAEARGISLEEYAKNVIEEELKNFQLPSDRPYPPAPPAPGE